MNTDGHLRSVFFGRNETMTIKDGILDGGEFAHVYFIDWDHVRARRRQLNITIMAPRMKLPTVNGTTGRSSAPCTDTSGRKGLLGKV
jgi:hypothetical protein